MAYGLKVWDGSGNLILDVTDRIARYITTVACTVPAAGQTNSYSISGFALDGTWFVYPDAMANYVRLTPVTGGINVTNMSSSGGPVGATFNVKVFTG